MTRLTEKGQVTIPKEVRDAAGAGPGADIEWSYDPSERQILGRLATDKPPPADIVERLNQPLPDPPYDQEQVQRIRRERLEASAALTATREENSRLHEEIAQLRPTGRRHRRDRKAAAANNS